MLRNKNNACNKAKINKSAKSYAIKLTPQLADGLRYLSDKTHKTQIGILKEIIEPMMHQAVSFEHFTYDVMSDRNMVEIIFYGRSNMLTMANSDFKSDDDFAEDIAEKYHVTKEKALELVT